MFSATIMYGINLHHITVLACVVSSSTVSIYYSFLCRYEFYDNHQTTPTTMLMFVAAAVFASAVVVAVPVPVPVVDAVVAAVDDISAPVWQKS